MSCHPAASKLDPSNSGDAGAVVDVGDADELGEEADVSGLVAVVEARIRASRADN